MTRWQQVARIARWEFNRFVKWRQQAYGVLIMLVVGGISGSVGKFVKQARGKEVRVAVVGADRLGFALPTVEGVRWIADRYTSDSSARTAVARDSVGGALLVRSSTQADIVVLKRGAWTTTVRNALSTSRQVATLAALPLDAEQRATMGAPFAVGVQTITNERGTTDTATRLFTGAILLVGVLVLFNGFASLFTGITGEKQQRITEQIIAMVSPQTWMDGKIIGLVGAAMAGTLFFSATGIFLLLALPRVLGTSPVNMPAAPTDIAPLLLVALVTVLGVVMWFAFMAAIAATIDDPNSSPRSVMLLIPILPMGLAFSLLARPDTWVAQLLSVFPLTSMAVLPVRLLMTSVPWWEPALAVVLLAGATWIFRRAAGKIFAVGILTHGKEPSLAETWRWVREAD